MGSEQTVDEPAHASLIALKRTIVPDVGSRTVYGVFAHVHTPGSPRPAMITMGETQIDSYALGHEYARNLIGSGSGSRLHLPAFDMPETLRWLQVRRDGDYLRYDPLTISERGWFLAGANEEMDTYPTRKPVDLTVAHLRKKLSEREWEEQKAVWSEAARSLGAAIMEHHPERANRVLERILAESRTGE